MISELDEYEGRTKCDSTPRETSLNLALVWQVHWPRYRYRKAAAGSLLSCDLSDSMYSEPEAASFRLRGVSYLEDGVKVPSAPFLFRLLLIDLFKSKLMTTNICARPDNRVFQAWKRGETDFYFVLNIMVPIKDGHTLSYVAYWKGDPQIFKQSSPFAKIATKFFDGDDDEFRNNRFKLIPRVVKGPYIVKLAVKDKPTLLGNKTAILERTKL